MISKLYRDGLDLRLFLRFLVLLALAVTMSTTTTDPDLWGHVRFGLDILDTHAIPRVDPYSFTSDRMWINHEWLAEVLFALAYRAAGPTGLNLLRIAIISLVLIVVWRRLAGKIAAGYAVIGLALAALGIFLRVYPVRPQLFSVLLFALLLRCIATYDDTRSRRSLFAIPLLTCAWANLHGGWIVGLGTLSVWAAVRVVITHRSWETALALSATIMAAIAATLINPYGAGLWTFLQSTVGMHRPLIADWQPVYALPPAFWAPFGLALAALLMIGSRVRRGIDPAYLGVAAMLGIASIRVSRLDAFFALAVAYLVLPALASRPAAVAPARPLRRSRMLAALTIPATAISAFLIVRQASAIDARPPMVPELDAEAYVRTHQLHGRMLTWFDWGEYVIWHFGPRLQVSMDGRRETVYSDDRVAAHMRFYFSGDGAVRYPDDIGADYIWVPKPLKVVEELKLAGWKPAFEGPASIILTRPGRPAPPLVTSTREESARAFPAQPPAF